MRTGDRPAVGRSRMTRRRGAGRAGQGRVRLLATASTDAEERGAAHRRRPAARAGGRDPGRQRRRPRRGRGRRHGAPGRSTACGSPTPGSRAWPTACARSPRCPTRSARCSTAGRRPNGLQIDAGPGAARRGRDHLREPAQRHERRGRALPEVGQRGAAAGLVDRAALQPRRRAVLREALGEGTACPKTR